jgi:hypothetical protein
MKTRIALALLAVLGFAAAGCGATKKIVVNVDTNSLATKIATEYTARSQSSAQRPQRLRM